MWLDVDAVDDVIDVDVDIHNVAEVDVDVAAGDVVDVDVDVYVDVDVVYVVDNPILIYFCHLVQSLTHSGGSLLLRRIL